MTAPTSRYRTALACGFVVFPVIYVTLIFVEGFFRGSAYFLALIIPIGLVSITGAVVKGSRLSKRVR